MPNPTWLDRALGAVGLQKRSFNPFTAQEWAYLLAGGGYGGLQTTYTSSKQELGGAYTQLAASAYGGNPIIFSLINARADLFSEARFCFQEMRNGRPGKLYGTPALRLLEEPFPGGSTEDVLLDAIIDADLAGNAFDARRPTTIQRLRPDWVTIIAGSKNPDANTWDLDVEILGFGYQPGGPAYGSTIEYLQRSEVAHFRTGRDPMRRFSGMSWLVPAIREIMGDNAATDHKLKFFENAATPNLKVKFAETMTLAQAKDWIDLFQKDHEGARNAYRTLFLGGGSDADIIGANLRQADFKVTQGAGETRLASAAGVPPIIVGLSEGLASATYSNYGQARRAYSDLKMRSLWRKMAGAFKVIVPAPAGSRLWYDDRDIPFLQEDMKDKADIQAQQAAAIRQLVDAGYDPESVTKAVIADDFDQLKHSGLYSVQLQPPGTKIVLPNGKDGEAKPALLNSARSETAAAPTSAEVRCGNCDRRLADLATAPFRFSCPRCKKITEMGLSAATS